MKVTVQKPVTIEVKYVEVVLPVKYEDEDIPFDAPGRVGDTWRAIIDIDTGRVTSVAKGTNWSNHYLTDWPVGTSLDLYMKVVDCGTYRLMDPVGGIVGEIEQNYVPHCVIPGEYGDYVELKIDAAGFVTNWSADLGDPEIFEFFGGRK